MNREEIFQHFPTMETTRLLLRQPEIEKDSKVLFDELYSDPDVIKYDFSRVYEVGKGGFSITPTMIGKMELWQQGFWGQRIIVWGLEYKSTKNLIGTCYCEFFSMNIVNIDSKLSKKYWKKGLMTEAYRAIIDFLEFHDIRQLVTSVNKTNLAGIKLYRKLGFSEVSINDLYFTKETGFGEAISLTGLIDTLKRPDEIIFVKPKINHQAMELLEKSEDAKRAGNMRNSLLLITKALEFQPNFVHALNSIAWAKLQMEDPHGAIHEFSKLLKIKPNKYTGLLGRAYAYSDVHQWEQAITDMVAYLKLQPNDSDSFVMLGNYLFQAKRYKEAVTAYDEALRINPNQQDAHQYKQNVISYL